jgi:pimeloyl-ACP methyl ester carboxylesterase
MTQPLHSTLLGVSAVGFHRIAYTQWGPADAPRTVLCVHGLTRNGRDFDALAAALAAAGNRVVCPDVVGRGRSAWLANPDLYGLPQYLADMTALIARLGVEQVDWVGTSMGGLIGLLAAALPGSPVRRLVLNDVGPWVPKAALERIAGYVGGDPAFADVAALEADMRANYAGFGRLSDAEWRHLATHSARTLPDGRVGYAYDPGIGKAFREQPIADIDLWALWAQIRCPVLAIRGATSDLLLAETAARMAGVGPEAAAGPRARLLEVADAGHAPALMAVDQIAVIRDFLDADSAPP